MAQLSISIPHTHPAVLISSNDPLLMKYCFDNLFPYASLVDDDISQSGFTITIQKCSQGYVVDYIDRKTPVMDQSAVLRSLSKTLNYIISVDLPYVAIHCAALSNNHCNFLLVGATGVGKSTMSAYLAYNGYEYYSDDKTIVDCATGEILPLSKPIHLRPGGKTLLETDYGIPIQGHSSKYGREERCHVAWQHDCLPKKLPLKIIFLQRAAEGNANISMLSVDNAFNYISRNLVYIGNLPRSIKLALRLVSNVTCHLLEYRDLGEVKHFLDSLT